MVLLDSKIEQQYFVAGLMVRGRMNNYRRSDFDTQDTAQVSANTIAYTHDNLGGDEDDSSTDR